MKPRGYRNALIRYAAKASRKPFVWGKHDCALFGAGWVQLQTGKDPARGLRGRYSTAAGAFKHLRKLGYDNIGDLVADQGLEEIMPAFAQFGDLAVLEGDGEIGALGGVQGEGIYVLRPDGIGVMPLMSARRAFRV